GRPHAHARVGFESGRSNENLTTTGFVSTKKLRTSCGRFASALRLGAMRVRRVISLQQLPSGAAFWSRRFGFNLRTEVACACPHPPLSPRGRGEKRAPSIPSPACGRGLG